ncbi:MAG: type II toxin-antitoxin system PemK/MazF family toxin [Anaerolineae bacterium]|nr:type II toxin-antitoxin system PemK/MazF family toxin [Anaerolineae bacterium]
MGQFIKGDVLVIPFPFSDLSASKKRPALVVASLSGDDVILCQITSKAKSDAYALPLASDDFATGALNQESFIRPNRLFTAASRIVLYKIGTLKSDAMGQVTQKVIEILKN